MSSPGLIRMVSRPDASIRVLCFCGCICWFIVLDGQKTLEHLCDVGQNLFEAVEGLGVELAEVLALERVQPLRELLDLCRGGPLVFDQVRVVCGECVLRVLKGDWIG